MKTELAGYPNKGTPVPRVLCHRFTGVTKFSGKGMRVLRNFQMFRVRIRMSCRTSGSSGYCGTGIRKSQKFRAGTKHGVPVPRVSWPRAYRTSRSSGYRHECGTYYLINWCISFHSCQILSPSKTDFIVSAHRLINITPLTLIRTP